MGGRSSWDAASNALQVPCTTPANKSIRIVHPRDTGGFSYGGEIELDVSQHVRGVQGTCNLESACDALRTKSQLHPNFLKVRSADSCACGAVGSSWHGSFLADDRAACRGGKQMCKVKRDELAGILAPLAQD